MKRAGWILAGYLLAVIVVAIMQFAVVVANGSPTVETGVERAGFLGKIIGAGVVAFAPLYLGARGVLRLFSAKSATPFILAFLAPCVLVFSGLAQVPDMWLIDWDSVSGDKVDLVQQEHLAANLLGGLEVGPFFFTGLGVIFWCFAGACFGSVIWWSEKKAAG